MVSPTSLDFGDVFVGSTATLTVEVKNVGDEAVAPNFTGGFPLDGDNFGGAQTCAGVTLDPDESCEFEYEFTPTLLGPLSTTTTIGVDAENFVIAMEGVGVSPYEVSPTSLDFGDVFVGSTATLTVEVKNVGDEAVAPNFTGGFPLDGDNFGGAQTCAGVTLDPDESCEFEYEFTPTLLGPLSTTTTIGVDAENFFITMEGVGAPNATLVITKVCDAGDVTVDFSITVAGLNIPQEVSLDCGETTNPGVGVVGGVPLVVSELPLPGYQPAEFGVDCAPDGSVTVTTGETATCTVTNPQAFFKYTAAEDEVLNRLEEFSWFIQVPVQDASWTLTDFLPLGMVLTGIDAPAGVACRTVLFLGLTCTSDTGATAVVELTVRAPFFCGDFTNQARLTVGSSDAEVVSDTVTVGGCRTAPVLDGNWWANLWSRLFG